VVRAPEAWSAGGILEADSLGEKPLQLADGDIGTDGVPAPRSGAAVRPLLLGSA